MGDWKKYADVYDPIKIGSIDGNSIFNKVNKLNNKIFQIKEPILTLTTKL